MPIGVPRIIYCWGEELPAQWTDIYNFIFRRRMVFLMQYLDDELCNQICGLLINIHMEDRSKEMEKKEMERSGVFKSSTKTSSLGPNSSKTQTNRSQETSSFYNAKARSMEDLLNADEDLGINEIDKLEQFTLQKITTEWLNWNAQFFDYSDEPYLYYLAELLSKDFNKSQTGQKVNENSEISQLLNMLKNKDGNLNNLANKGNIQMGEVYSPFRTNANFSSASASDSDSASFQAENKFKQEMLFKHNLFSGKKVAKKQKLLQMFQEYQKLSTSTIGIYNKQKLKHDKTHKNISNLLSNLAQNDFSSKIASSNYFTESSEKMLSQRNLRREFTLENNFSNNFNSFDNKQIDNAMDSIYYNKHMKSFNYLNSSAFSENNAQSEFRDYYRKQTERTLMDEESKKVFVIINSFGGSVGNGITVHDALQFIKAGSLTLALGVAASAASLALAGGTIGERYVTEGCHTMIHQPECLTPDHEVLTNSGWVPIAEVTLEHKVAVLDSKGVMTYEHPTKIHTYDYKGPIYEVKTQGIDLMVTPNHRMYVSVANSERVKNYSLLEASEIAGKRARYKNNAIWDVPDYQFVLPAIEKKTRYENTVRIVDEVKPDMDNWLTFMGLWISEGHTEKENKEPPYIVTITQVKENVREVIVETCKKLGFHAILHNQKQYSISQKQLWSYLNPLDTGALNKRLPDWVWKLSSRQCNILLDALVMGDGYVNKNDGTIHYFTGSKGLGLDVCRLALHAGSAATMLLEDAPSRSFRTIKGEPILTNNPLWRVNIIKSSFYPYSNYLSPTLAAAEKQKMNSPKTNVSDDEINVMNLTSNRENNKTNDRFIDYEGPVHCLTVPNSVFYVQRNGKPLWTGNSSLQGQASDIWIDSQEIMKIRLDVAEIYSLSTYRPRHKILRDLDRDFYLTATETIQYGLADEIATNEVMQNIVELTHQAWDVHDATQERLLDSRARLVGDSAQTQESTG